MFRKFSLVLVAVFSLYSISAGALGLGEIKLKSGLNQPLKAEIELLSAESMSEFEIAASLASMVEFEKNGIDYLNWLKHLRFATVKNQNGKLVVEITTRQPVKEPYLNFLVEMNWPKGRMLREYTVLLDPPIFNETSASTLQQARSSSNQSAPSPAKPATQIKQSTQSSVPVFSGNSYGPVEQNETLWRIATQVRPNNATIHQTLVALYRANPDAFVNSDINMLKQGSTLVVPDSTAIGSIPHRAALQDMVARTRGTHSESVLDTSGRKRTEGQVKRGEDRLRLASPANDSGDVKGTGGDGQRLNELSSSLSRTKEANATLQAENEELRRQLQDALEKLERDQKSGLEVESSVATVLAQKNQPDSQTTTGDSSETADIETDLAITQEPIENTASNESISGLDSNMSDSGESTSLQSDGLTEDSTTKVDEVSDTASSSINTANTINTTPKVITTNEPVSTGFFDDPMVLYGSAGLAVVLLGAFFVFWRMRKRMSDNEFQDDLVGSAQRGSFDTEESIDMPDVGDDLLDDIDSDDLFEDESGQADPLGEADIYIAYGKYEQAEKLLLEAIEAQPQRIDLKVKLLECYSETKDKHSFDSVESLYADEFSENPETANQVQALKSQAWPEEHVLDDEFELPSTEEIFGDDDAIHGAENEDDFSLDDLDTTTEVTLADTMDDVQISGEEDSFDTDEFDFDLESEKASEESFSLADDADEILAETRDDLDLDTDDFSLEDDSFSLDDESDTAPEPALDVSDDLNMDLAEEFDFEDEGGLDEGFVDSADEASTKLDLARAYIDMGDTDGAREILNEVMEEGNESHKSEALKLLEKI